MAAVRPVPEGFHTFTPYLTVRDAKAAIEFYKQAFGASEVLRLTGKDGRIGHAEIKIGDSLIMLADEHPEWGNLSPKSLGGSPVTLHLYLTDVDAVCAQAVGAGALLTMPPADQFYGDRSARLTDPFGHVWLVATHIEDVPQEEVQRRFDAMMGG